MWESLGEDGEQDGYVSAEQLTRLLRSDGTENAEEEMLSDLDPDEVAEVEIPRDEDDDVEDDARVELGQHPRGANSQPFVQEVGQGWSTRR